MRQMTIDFIGSDDKRLFVRITQDEYESFIDWLNSNDKNSYAIAQEKEFYYIMRDSIAYISVSRTIYN